MLPTANSRISSQPPDLIGQAVMLNNNNYLPGVYEGFNRIESIPESQMGEDFQYGAENVPHGMVHDPSMSEDTVMLQNDGDCAISAEGIPKHSPPSVNDVNQFSGHPIMNTNGGPPFVTFNNQAAYNNTCIPSFTFTTPTQSSLYSPALMSPVRHQYSGTSAHMFSPTVCTPMKHSTPVRIPWAAASLGMTVSSSGVSLFSAPLNTVPAPAAMEPAYCISPSMATCSYSSTMCSNSKRRYPILSCSQTPRRPKRQSTQNIDLLSPTNKVHLTEEKIAAHMQELRISGLSPPLLTGSLSPLQNGAQQSLHAGAQLPLQTVAHLPLQHGTMPPLQAGAQLPLQTGAQLPLQTGTMLDTPPDILTCTAFRNTQFPDIVDHLPLMSGADKGFRSLTQDQQWQTFKDLEERLDISDDDTPESERNYQTPTDPEPKLHFVSEIERLPRNEPVIPPEILKELNKPRLEVVLWTPPGDLVKNAIGFPHDATLHPVKSTNKQSTDLVKTQRLLSSIQEDGCMDTDMMDDSIE